MNRVLACFPFRAVKISSCQSQLSQITWVPTGVPVTSALSSLSSMTGKPHGGRDVAWPENEEMVFMPVFTRLEVVPAHLNDFLKQQNESTVISLAHLTWDTYQS